MKISVLVIAHNEEGMIGQCLASLMNQTRAPDEIIVVCHNCTDDTVAIARTFSKVTLVEENGPEGVPYARIRGFEEVTGDIVACLDGDAYADKHWVENITRPLIDNADTTLVAGYVVLTNDLFARLTSFWQFVLLKKIFKLRVNYFAWGSSFACRKGDYERVGGMRPLIALRQTLPLHFWAEDFYISQALMQIGKMHVALNAKSYTTVPYSKINLATAPIKEWMEDNKILLRYFKKNKRN
ncbi:MAG: glycosyl transferase family 2 [Candidatus Nomurabacteria bacterium]|nr:glycosyl transferase family 2 [Candidatus Nomurabacteria bacterium]